MSFFPSRTTLPSRRLTRLAGLAHAASIALAAGVVVGAAPGCSSSSSSGSTATAPTGPYARFILPTSAMPNFLDVPFPSDAYLTASHMVSETIPGIESVVTLNQNFLTHEIAKSNGFSRIAPILFWIDDASSGTTLPATVDTTTLPTSETACVADSSAVFLIDLAATDITQARVPCRAKYHDDSSLSKVTRPGLAVGPGRGYLLQEGHSYAAVLTSRVKITSGKALGASTDFQDVVAGNRSDTNGQLYANAVATVKKDLAAALATDGAELVAVAPYTTNSETAQLYKLRDTIEAEAAQPLTWDTGTVAPMVPARFAAGTTAPTGFTATLDAWLGTATKKLADGTDDPDASLKQTAHDKIQAIGTGVFTANNYLQSLTGGYPTLDDATFTFDANGDIVPPSANPTEKIWVSIAIPTGTMPSGGWPVVIAQHGLGQDRSFLLNLANVYATKGWATVAIDSVTFGARAPEAKYQVDTDSTFQGNTGVTYKGPDGFADQIGGSVIAAGSTNGESDFFGGLLNIGAIRDQFRQAMIDTVQLVKLVKSSPNLEPLNTGSGTPKFDTTKIAYLGNSLGGIEGAGAAALEPSLKAWTLNVAGGGIFTELASHGPTIASSLTAAGSFNFGFGNDVYDEAHPFIILLQNLVEPGDPIAFAEGLQKSPHTLAGAATTARNVLQVEVVYDELVSNESNEALARAAGFTLATPNVGSNAGVTNLDGTTGSVAPVPLTAAVAGSDGTFHDTPSAGFTGILVQQSPGQHGANLVSSIGQRNWQIPYLTSTGTVHFAPAGADKIAPCSYLEIQSTMTGFFGSAFDGKVPTVSGFKTPVRDADGDGVPDDMDAAPVDATTH